VLAVNPVSFIPILLINVVLFESLAADEPVPYILLFAYDEAEPLKVNSITVLEAVLLPENFSTKSVYVCGIEVKDMLAAPPAPTVCVLIRLIVFGIVAP
jgi:hypothetical protein